MLFVTWRLRGSLHQKPHCATAAAVDRHLDRDRSESHLLGNPRLAAIVKKAILKREADLYDLKAWVVMHNHMHLLIQPRAGMSLITRSIMDETEEQARTAIWARESYEIPVNGNAPEIAHRIEHHPVRAGLVSRPEEWPWSSAYLEAAHRRKKPSEAA